MSEASARGRAGARARAAYLGPEGTFSEEALLSSAGAAIEPVAVETIRDAVLAVQEGAVEWAVVPIENSIEGSVTVTLDTLAGEASDVAIMGEVVLPVRHCLIARGPVTLAEIDTVVSHPHVPGQCARFLREELSHARFVAASSTAEAVRLLTEREGSAASGGAGPSTEEVAAGGTAQGSYGAWAAIGTRLAANIYGCVVVSEGIQDRDDNETRFVWLAREGSSPPAGGPEWGAAKPDGAEPGGAKYKTSLVFWGAGADRAGWLVLCLSEFASREINLTKIESRPRRERLGHYMFFVDLEGSLRDEAVGEALKGLRSLCEEVRVLGSYPAAG